MKKSRMLISELPDCVKSYIFSKLSLKDLVKISALSKTWTHEWGLRMDINFDLHNMFDHNKVQELPKTLPLFKEFQSQFATRLDQFMLHHKGSMIHSIRVDFPLGDEHSEVIDRMISEGIAKGAKRIELIFSYDAASDDLISKIEPYKLSSTLLSSAASLTYLHLEKCRVAPMDNLSGLKNLRTLLLRHVVVEQDMIHDLFSNCMHLEEFTLNACKLNYDLKIISPTLLKFNIVDCQKKRNIDLEIVASNLSSIDFSYRYRSHIMNVTAPMLTKFSYKGRRITKLVGYSGMRNLTTIVLDGLNECLVGRRGLDMWRKCLNI